MGKIYDTTDFVGTSIEKKSKLGKNFEIKDNYWIESLQHDVNHKWNFTSNRVDVEEEVQRFNDDNYVKAHTHYQNIEVRLNKVYDDHGKQLSPDFKQLIFRDINHKTKLIIDEEDAEEDIIEPSEEAEETNNEEVEEEINYDEEIFDDDETEDDLKDLVIMDENEESEIA